MGWRYTQVSQSKLTSSLVNDPDTVPKGSGFGRPPFMRNILVLLMAANSGFLDACCFLVLGSTFSSVMTGNMVIFGIEVGRFQPMGAVLAGSAIVAFMVGCLVGAGVAGKHLPSDPPWPPSITRSLLIEFTIMIGFSAWWWLEHGAPSGEARLGLLIFCATALGVQSAAVQRFGIGGLSTTYLTGTLTQLMIRLSSTRRLNGSGFSIALLSFLILGAALGSVIAAQLPMAVPIFPLLSLFLIILVSRSRLVSS